MSDISHQAISHSIWDMKYRLKAPDGTPIDRDLGDSWARVALALSEAESPDQRVARAEEFAHALAGHRFQSNFTRIAARHPSAGVDHVAPMSRRSPTVMRNQQKLSPS